MKSLSTFMQESLAQDDMLFVKSVVESHGYIGEGAFDDFMKKLGFDLSDEMRKQLTLKSKLWKMPLTDEELERLIVTGKADKFRGAYQIRNNKIEYINMAELAKSKFVIPSHYVSGY